MSTPCRFPVIGNDEIGHLGWLWREKTLLLAPQITFARLNTTELLPDVLRGILQSRCDDVVGLGSIIPCKILHLHARLLDGNSGLVRLMVVILEISRLPACYVGGDGSFAVPRPRGDTCPTNPVILALFLVVHVPVDAQLILPLVGFNEANIHDL